MDDTKQVAFNLNLPFDIAAVLTQMAKDSHRSRSGMIREILSRTAREWQSAHPPVVERAREAARDERPEYDDGICEDCTSGKHWTCVNTKCECYCKTDPRARVLPPVPRPVVQAPVVQAPVIPPPAAKPGVFPANILDEPEILDQDEILAAMRPEVRALVEIEIGARPPSHGQVNQKAWARWLKHEEKIAEEKLAMGDDEEPAATGPPWLASK